jgi:hypothetical protein
VGNLGGPIVAANGDEAVRRLWPLSEHRADRSRGRDAGQAGATLCRALDATVNGAVDRNREPNIHEPHTGEGRA